MLGPLTTKAIDHKLANGPPLAIVLPAARWRKGEFLTKSGRREPANGIHSAIIFTDDEGNARRFKNSQPFLRF
jgi:hypothetical protein